MLREQAQLFSDVFAPELFVLLCAVLAVGYEWRRDGTATVQTLGARYAVLVVAWGVAFVVYQSSPVWFADPPTWAPDFLGSVGLGVGLLVIAGAWRVGEWGTLVPDYVGALLALTAVHLVVTPFWDVSSHVAYTAVPAGALAVVDRRFAPLLVVPVGMVFARPLAGAHTWLQSVGGLVLGAAFVVWFHERSEWTVTGQRSR
ncbi:hypothetical protein [Halospeciosus flavus]|uniref:PAP2 superfamily protein n=1 Tax=Halospeciosus flavus TaxID=3032283 RepID=A0ABD5Z2Q6_9EURY|nr:hypothetical protein [Halospeciosus flavus]